MIKKIISGGQTGADQGALFAARDLGLETGGFAPRGWKTEAGPALWLAEYGLVEAPSSGYPQRTRLNVLNSDATLIFGDPTSPGCRLTIRYASVFNRMLDICSWTTGSPTPRVSEHGEWFRNVKVLNVAGNRESRAPGITDTVREFLNLALRSDR